MEKEFDIYKRSLDFSKDLLLFTKRLPREIEIDVVRRQLVRCGTSIGANIHESNGGHTRKDFANYMNVALKSANETIYWLDLLQELVPKLGAEMESLKKEANEIRKIVATISIKTREKK